MVEVINSSFIPKSEFSSRGENKRKRGGAKLNVFFLISLIIFLSTIIAVVGVWLWREDLRTGNKELKEHFTKNKENYGVETIKNFSNLSNRIEVGRELLMNHYSVTPILNFLERSTQTNIILKEFTLEEGGSMIYVKSLGIAPDLEDLYLQSKSYTKNQNVKDFLISNISRDEEGSVLFNMEFSVDKKELTEREFIN